MVETRDGLPVSARTPAGAALLDDAIESYLGSRTDTPQILKHAISADSGMLMTRCFMGYLVKLAGDARNGAIAAALHRTLAEEVAAGAGTSWERAHVAALGLWIDDQLEALITHFEAVIDQYPQDVLSLRMLHYLYFYDGDAEGMRDSVAARMNHYRGHPLEGYVQGMFAFGLEESGDYPQAERWGRNAVETNDRDLWAAHAVAHVMEMQGRCDEGVAWIQALRPRWREGNNFRFHLYWHEALYHLSRRDVPRVLAIYDEEVAPAVADDFYLDVCNASSLLLRLEARGIDVGDRWQPLAEVAGRHVADTELVFASLHYLMPLLRVGSENAGELLATLEGWAARDTSQGRLVRNTAWHVAQYLVARQAGEKTRALALFQGFQAELYRIGGSHAQRQLFTLLAETAAPTAVG